MSTLADRAQSALAACGATIPAATGGPHRRRGVPDRRLRPRDGAGPGLRRGGCGRRAGPRGVPGVAHDAGSRARLPREGLRPAARGAQGRPRRPRPAGGREDPLRGPRRGAGDDRHLRLRPGAVPPARGTHDAVGAPGPPAHGDLAPGGRGRRHLGLQLPRGRLGLEHRRRPGLRRRRRLEAVGAHAADRAGLHGAAGPGDRGPGRSGRRPRPGDRRAGCRARPGRQPAASRSSARPGPSAWAPRSVRASPPGSAGPSSNWAATTRPSSLRPPTSSSPSAGSSSPPPAPPVSGARRCGASSPTRPSSTRWCGAWPRSTAGCRSAARWRTPRSSGR